MPTSYSSNTVGTVKVSFAVSGSSLGPTVADLIAAIRARCETTLPEIVRSPEGLYAAINQDVVTLYPCIVIVAQQAQDISSQFAVFDVAQLIPVDLVYCAQTTMDGTTDAAQYQRQRLTTLEQAFMSDRRLGGIVSKTVVRSVPEQRSNEYEQFFAANQQVLTAMVLGLDFTMVRSIVPGG